MSYQSHFGLSRPLINDGLAQDEAVFRPAAAARTAGELAAALKRRDAVAILSGPSGTGKTTLAMDALQNVGTRLAFACISQAPQSAEELLELLLTDFGFEPGRSSRVERLQLWRQFLSEMTATETRVCLLVENADTIAGDILLALHALTAADAALSRGANVILTTTQRPESLLVSPEMLAFNQRVCLRRRIEPLTEAEVLEYLHFKCGRAGGDPDRIVNPDAAAMLHDYSGGVIRVIDNLLEAALGAAAAAGEVALSGARVAEIAVQRFGLARLDAREVDRLLTDSEEIPTLTEIVLPLPGLPELSPAVRRAARA